MNDFHMNMIVAIGIVIILIITTIRTRKIVGRIRNEMRVSNEERKQALANLSEYKTLCRCSDCGHDSPAVRITTHRGPGNIDALFPCLYCGVAYSFAMNDLNEIYQKHGPGFTVTYDSSKEMPSDKNKTSFVQAPAGYTRRRCMY